jgi:pSer/pThr/pTyr-binding forkhead associated (FHA) protein
VTVSFEHIEDVETGTFRVRSGVTPGSIDEPLPAASTGHPRLLITDRPGAVPREVSVERDAAVVGRGSEAHIRIEDAGVSRRHAEVRREGDEVFLVDLGSTNGTTVNGRAVERIRLTPGDRISIGRTVLIYERDDG